MAAVSGGGGAGAVTGVVLAGGRGSRMGGRDKGLVELAGRPMVCQVLDVLAPQVDALLVNANRNAAQYRQLGYEVIADRDGNYQGPLAGMLSGLRAARTPWAVFAPCDAPLTPVDLVARLGAARRRDDAELAVACDGVRLQPVFCLLATALADSIEAFLAGGERKIDRWFAQHKMASADFPEASADFPQGATLFANINTPDELAWAEEQLAARAHKG